MPRNFLFCFALIFSIVSDACATLDSVSPTAAAAWRNSYSGTNYPTQRAAADAACATGGWLFNYYIPWGTDSNGVVTTWQVYCAGTGHQYGGVWQASAAVCPTPTAQPTIPYAWNPSNGMCERSIVAACPAHSHGTPPSCICETGYKFDAARTSCVQEQYTIALQNILADVEPSGTTKVYAATSRAVYAQVIDRQTGLPKVGAQVKFGVDVIAGTGGHDHHDALRPKGKLLDCRDNTTEVESTVCITQLDGRATVTFKAPEVSGTHTIAAECVKKVDGLEPIPISPFYNMQLPNRDTNHPKTHFLMVAPQKKLETIAILYMLKTLYMRRQGVQPDITLNDASLEWGGVLDCFLTCNSAQYPSTPWHKHHLEHRRGSVVDVKANGALGSIIYEADFIKMARRLKADPGNPHGSGSSRHYHLRLNRVKE